MKKLLFLLIFLSCLSCSNRRITSTKLINLRKERVFVDVKKTNYFIILSTQSCHQCYLETQNFLLKNNLYNDSSKVVSVIAINTKENFKGVSIRKSYYNLAKDYFPQMKNIYYSDNLKGKYALLFGTNIHVMGNPIIIVIKNGKVFSYKYDNFISSVAEDLLSDLR